jgi:hypothetical protein
MLQGTGVNLDAGKLTVQAEQMDGSEYHEQEIIDI